MGVSENVVYPIVPNGFADHSIPMKNGYFIGNFNPTFSDKPNWDEQAAKDADFTRIFLNLRSHHEKLSRDLSKKQSATELTEQLLDLKQQGFVQHISRNGRC